MKTMSNIKYKEANIFESEDQTIVNTVNTVGVMGKGLALEFKRRYPEMFKNYREICKNNELNIGKLYLYKDSKPWILNFPTKKDWREKSKLEYIERGLRGFTNEYKSWKIKSISFPQLGCRNGGLEWYNVKPLMEKYLGDLDIPVTIYIYTEPILDQFLLKYEIPEEISSRWKLTRNKSGFYCPLGDIKVFWDFGSNEVKIKIPDSSRGLVLISSVDLGSLISESMGKTINLLNDRGYLLDDNSKSEFTDILSNDLESIRNLIDKKFNGRNLSILLSMMSPFDFYDALQKLDLLGKYEDLKKSLIDSAVSKITSSNLIRRKLKTLSNSQKLLLSIIMKNKGRIEFSKLRESFKKHKSTSTFYKSLGILKENLILFEIPQEGMLESLIVVPFEFQSLIGEIEKKSKR